MSRPVDPRLLQRLPLLRKLLAQLGVLQGIGALLTVAQAWLLADLVVSAVLTGGRQHHLTRGLCELAAVGGGRACIAAAQEWLTADASGRSRSELRRAALTAATRLGPGWNAGQVRGDVALTIGPGLDALDGYLTRALPALVGAGVVPGIVLLAIGFDDWRSAALLALVIPLVPIFMVLVGMTTRRQMSIQHEALGRLAGHFLDLLQGIATIKIYGQSKAQIDTVRRTTTIYRRQTLRTLRVALLSGLVLDVIATLSVAVVAVAVGLRLDRGHVSLRTALIALLLAPELFAPLRALGTNHHTSEDGLAAAGSLLDILDESDLQRSEQVDPDKGNSRVGSGLVVRNLSVTYPGRDVDALHNLSFEIPSGRSLAIVGRSGSGKSTVIATLLRFVEPTTGAVWSDHVQMADLAAADWRANLAWVPQRPRPTQPTVGREVALADPGATPAQIDSVLACAHAPAAETELGESGAAISAGQRRRVAMARALLRVQCVQAAGGTPLLLLDEPTEDLDAETERIITSVISSLSGLATVIVVTHSQQLAATADRVMTLDMGRCTGISTRQPLRFQPSPPAVVSAGSVRLSTARVENKGPQVSLRELVRPVGIGRRLGGAVVLAGLTGLCGLALTGTSLWLLCRAAQHPNVQAIAIAVVGVRTFALARAALRYAERLVSHDVAMRILADLRARVFAALIPLAPTGLLQVRRGDLLRRFVSDIDGAQEGLVRAVVPMGGAVVTAVGATLAAGLILPGAGLVLAGGIVVAGLIAPMAARRLAGSGTVAADAAGRRDAVVIATVEGLAEIVAYGAETTALGSLDAADEVVRTVARAPARAATLGIVLSGFASAGITTIVLSLALAAVRSGNLSVLKTAVLLACCLSAFDAVAPLPSAFAALGRCRAGLMRVGAILSQAPPIAEPANRVEVTAAINGLAIRGLTLRPAPSAVVVLAGAALTVERGQRVALTGPSGAGKSTLLSAVLRLTGWDCGDIEVRTAGADVSLAEIAASELPPLVAGSLQGDHVFNASLRDNLRFVRPSATDDQLDAVAARAGLGEFIQGLPGGWDTPAGADGNLLSGGERQRLLIARALLAAPAILVLDEPTAHLDAATERSVMADLLSTTWGQTVLLSTHRHLAGDRVDATVDISNGTLTTVRHRDVAQVG